jgi:hypothetical protein
MFTYLPVMGNTSYSWIPLDFLPQGIIYIKKKIRFADNEEDIIIQCFFLEYKWIRIFKYVKGIRKPSWQEAACCKQDTDSRLHQRNLNFQHFTNWLFWIPSSSY